MDFTKIRGKKTARFNEGDLVVCIFKGDASTGVPHWNETMDRITGAVLEVTDEARGIACLEVRELNGTRWTMRPEWVIPAYDPENTLRLGEPVLHRYGKKVYLRTVKSIVGSYCELDNGSVFHHSKLYNAQRALVYVTWPALWSDCFGLEGGWDRGISRKFMNDTRDFNRANSVR